MNKSAPPFRSTESDVVASALEPANLHPRRSMQWIAVVHVVEQATSSNSPEADESPLKSPMWPSTESAVPAALELVRVLSSRLYAW
eukprot:3811008-Alexandrium_andersonii.AAC.1